jgi:hypothetical protein
MAPKKINKTRNGIFGQPSFFFFFPGWRWTTVISSLDDPIVSSVYGERPRSRLAQSWGSPKTWPSLEGVASPLSVEQLGGVFRYFFNEFRHGFSISKWHLGHTIGLGSCSIAIYPLPKMVS